MRGHLSVPDLMKSNFRSSDTIGNGLLLFLDRPKAMTLIEEIRKALTMEIRSNSQGSEYLEAVINSKALELFTSLLRKYLGAAANENGKEANLPKEIQNIVDLL